MHPLYQVSVFSYEHTKTQYVVYRWAPVQSLVSRLQTFVLTFVLSFLRIVVGAPPFEFELTTSP